MSPGVAAVIRCTSHADSQWTTGQRIERWGRREELVDLIITYNFPLQSALQDFSALWVLRVFFAKGFGWIICEALKCVSGCLDVRASPKHAAMETSLLWCHKGQLMYNSQHPQPPCEISPHTPLHTRSLNSSHNWAVSQGTANRGLNAAPLLFKPCMTAIWNELRRKKNPLPQCGTLKYPLNVSLCVPGDPKTQHFFNVGAKPQMEWQARQCWVMWRNAESEEHLPQKLSEKRSISLNVSSCWWLICSWWRAGIGAVAMGKSATVPSLWVPSMAINWLPAALGRGTTDASNWKASSSSAKPIPTESGRASVDFWTYSEQMWTWKGEGGGLFWR